MKRLTSTTLNKRFNEYKEECRVFCRRELKGSNKEETAKNRVKAAKAIGYTLATLNASLNERNNGSREFWFKLCYYIATKNNSEIDLSAFFNKESTLSQLTNSERRFVDLSKIPIVTEDVKFRLVASIEQMLLDINLNLEKSDRAKLK